MFTLAQIHEAHARVQSGSDFPKYIQELIGLGVQKFDTFVDDSRSVYYGENNLTIQSEGQYASLSVSDNGNIDLFKQYLKMHQEGKTDYMQFCKDAAECGVEKWQVDTKDMTCIYYDKSGLRMLSESIPSF